MSEYWVSKKKYFCKYCDIYIADDAPSRQHHENGMKHKGNVERFIRGLYKGSERRKKDQDEEKREMARVEQAAQAAYSQDVAAGRAKPGAGPVPSTSSATARKPPPKPSNPYANYSTAASLGFTDPDAERFAAEAEKRRTQGVAGNWEVVATITPVTPQIATDEGKDVSEHSPHKVESEQSANTGVKRGAEAPPDEDDARQFKLRKKTWGVGLGEVYDPAAIPIKLKKKEEPIETTTASEPAPTLATTSTASNTDAPRWKKVQWKRPGEDVKEDTQDSQTKSPVVDDQTINTEQVPLELKVPHRDSTSPMEDLKPPIFKDEDALPTTSMFRRRKLPVGQGSRGK